MRALMHGNRTGVEVFSEKIIENIIKLDIKHEYVLFYSGFKRIDWSVFDWSKELSIIHTRIPNKILNILLALFSWPKLDSIIERKIAKRVEFFFMPDLRPVALKKAKLITVIHDLSFFRHPDFFSLKARIWHKLLNPGKIAEKSNKIIAVSEFTASELHNVLNIDPEKIRVIYEGPGSTKAVSDIYKMKVKKKYRINKPFFFFVSSLEPRKNINRLIDAFVQFSLKNKNFSLIIAGSRNEAIFKNVEFKSGHEIIFLGKISELEKSALLSLSYALVYPSIYEGFGLPVLESFSFGKPVIASRTGSLPEVVGEAGILINPLDTKEICQAMMQLSDPVQYEKLSAKISPHLAKFSWSKCAKNMIDYFSLSR